MPSLRVVGGGKNLVIRNDEVLGFGRTNLEPGGAAGWGGSTRFLELSPDPHISRRWGELVWTSGMWCVRNLSSLLPIQVELPSGSSVDLQPWSSLSQERGETPDMLGVTQATFAIDLRAGAHHWRIEFQSVAGPGEVIDLRDIRSGVPTQGLTSLLVDSITELEFNVLWAMATEYREAATCSVARSVPPRPLSYLRITRLLGLSTQRSAIAAVERLTGRFRDGHLLEGVPSDEQRATMCRIATSQPLLEDLVRKYGIPTGATVGGER